MESIPLRGGNTYWLARHLTNVSGVSAWRPKKPTVDDRTIYDIGFPDITVPFDYIPGGVDDELTPGADEDLQ